MPTVHDHLWTHYGAKLGQQYHPCSPYPFCLLSINSSQYHLLLILRSFCRNFYSFSTTSTLHFCLLSWLWQGFLPKLSSNLNSTVLQNWILMPLKHLLPESLQQIIHPFKASHLFPIFWQIFESLFCLLQWWCSLMNSSCIWPQCSLPLLHKNY